MQEQSEPHKPVEDPPKGGLWKLQALIFEPRKAFEEINRKPTWLLPISLCVVLGALSFTLLFQTLGAQGLFEKAMEMSGMQREVPEGQMEMMGTFMQIQGYAAALLAPLLGTLLMAGIYLILFYLFGGESTYKKFLSVVAHSFFVYSLITTLLLAGVIWITADPWDINLESPATTNLSFLFARQDSPVLYTLAAAIDLPTFYFLFLAGLGISVVSRRTSLATGITVVIIPYLLLTVGKSVFAYFMS